MGLHLMCPGCGNMQLHGPYEADEDTYYECPDCDRHIYAYELGG